MKKRPVSGKTVDSRDYRYDNIKFILIVLVVCGHLLELFKGADALYKFIYSFHMPVFIFVTGRFAKFDIKKILCKLVVPYFIFQILYLIFDATVLKQKTPKIQFTTPYWLLWYLFAIIIYYIVVFVLPKKVNNALSLGIIVVAFLAGILIGYVEKAGYYLSVSRIVVFFPFFLLGYYSREFEDDKRLSDILSKKWLVIAEVILAVSGSLLIIKQKIPNKILYGSYSYETGKGQWWMRLLIYIVALFWIGVFTNIVSGRKLTVITSYGQNTLPIFLMHGFVVKLLKRYDFFKYGLYMNMLFVCIITAVVVLLFGYPWIKAALGFDKRKN